VALAANHQVIVDGDAQRLGGGLDLARHVDVVARGFASTADAFNKDIEPPVLVFEGK
jgi:hypothetical protein